MFCRFLRALCIGPCVMGEGHEILSRPLLFFFPPSDSGPVWFLADTMSHFLLKEYTQFAIFKPHFPRNLFSSKSPHPLNDECSFFTSVHRSLPSIALKYIVLNSTSDSGGFSGSSNQGKEERLNIVNDWKAAAEACVWCYETLQDPTPPPQWLVDSFLSGWALSPAIARFHPTPSPLLSHSDLESQ